MGIYVNTLRAVNGLSIGRTWRGTREAGAGTLRCCVHCKLPNGWCCLVGVRELAARTVRMTPCVLLTHIRTWNISISRTNPRELPARAASQRQQPALRGPRVCVREVPHAGTHKLHVDIGRISVSNFLDRPHPVDVPPDLQHSAALGETVRAVGRAGLFSHLLQGEVAAVPGLREIDDRNRNLDQCALVRRPSLWKAMIQSSGPSLASPGEPQRRALADLPSPRAADGSCSRRLRAHNSPSRGAKGEPGRAASSPTTTAHCPARLMSAWIAHSMCSSWPLFAASDSVPDSHCSAHRVRRALRARQAWPAPRACAGWSPA